MFKTLTSVAVVFGLLSCAVPRLNAETMVATDGAPPPGMTLSNLLQLVIERNEALQSTVLEFGAKRHYHLASRGIFEPDFVASADREVNNRPNNAQQLNTDQTSILHETNNIYDGGIESLIPTGAKFHLGYNLSDLRNNIPISFNALTNGVNPTALQYQSFFGLTVDQPLLKNFGPAVTMAGIRLAALDSKMAFQEYRKQLMTVISLAEATYWNLYYYQELVRALEESVHNGESILEDNRTRVQAGKMSELELMEAQSELALRQAKLGDARRSLVEAANGIVTLYAGRAGGTNVMLRAVDAPHFKEQKTDIEVLGRSAFLMNPDYIKQQEAVDKKLISLGYAKNQLLPQLDLKGAYGLNGLGQSPGASWDDIQHEHFTSWSVGAEFRIALGMTKVRHEYTAAELELQSEEMRLKSLQTEIFNGLETGRQKVVSLRDSVASYDTAANYARKLYEDSVVQQQAGKVETLRVFKLEEDWFDARADAVKTMVGYQIELLKLQGLSGTLLEQHHLDLTQEDLQRSTRAMLKDGRVGTAKFIQSDNEHSANYPGGIGAGPGPYDSALRDAIHSREKELDQQSSKATTPSNP